MTPWRSNAGCGLWCAGARGARISAPSSWCTRNRKGRNPSEARTPGSHCATVRDARPSAVRPALLLPRAPVLLLGPVAVRLERDRGGRGRLDYPNPIREVPLPVVEHERGIVGPDRRPVVGQYRKRQRSTRTPTTPVRRTYETYPKMARGLSSAHNGPPGEAKEARHIERTALGQAYVSSVTWGTSFDVQQLLTSGGRK